MPARKPVDPRVEVRIDEAGPADPSRGHEEEPVSSGEAEEPVTDAPRRHANVEMESGPVDREDRDDPLPEAP